jgi:hypothetical protein
MEEIEIKSAHSASLIRFFGIEGDYFRVEMTNPEYSGAVRVWAYTDAHGLADLFAIIAENWKGWQGEKKWSSIEGEFSIIATSDKLGHISLSVEMHHDFGATEPWQLKSTVVVDAGQLDAIAKDAKAFFKT